MQPRGEGRFSPKTGKLFPYAHEDILRYLLRHHPIAKHAGTKCIHAIDVNTRNSAGQPSRSNPFTMSGNSAIRVIQ